MFDHEIVCFRNPFHPRDVVIAGIAGNGNPARVTPSGTDNADAHGGVCSAGDGVGNVEALGIAAGTGIGKTGDDFAGGAEIVEQGENADAGSIELPVSDLAAVGTPAKAIAQKEFFFVDPIGSAVDDGVGTVVSELHDDAGREVFDVDVVGANVPDLRSVGRKLGEHERGFGSGTAKFFEGAGFLVENPVVAARGGAPDAFGVG